MYIQVKPVKNWRDKKGFSKAPNDIWSEENSRLTGTRVLLLHFFLRPPVLKMSSMTDKKKDPPANKKCVDDDLPNFLMINNKYIL